MKFLEFLASLILIFLPVLIQISGSNLILGIDTFKSRRRKYLIEDL